MRWHQLDIQEVFNQCNTSVEGLKRAEAKERLKHYGLNTLPEQEALSRFKILLHQFKSPLIYILIVAAVVTTLLKEIYRYWCNSSCRYPQCHCWIFSGV